MAPALAALDLALGQLQHVVCRLANGAKDRAAPDWEGLGELHGEVRTRQRHAVYLGLPARNRDHLDFAYDCARRTSDNLYDSSGDTKTVEPEHQGWSSALLQNLTAGAGSSSQFIGGLIVALLYVVIGLLGAIGSIVVFRRIFQGRWEQIFWASFLVVIAAFYLSFAAYFGASTHAWQTEVVGVTVFLVCAVGGLFSRFAIAVGLCHAWALGSQRIVCPALPLRACR